MALALISPAFWWTLILVSFGLFALARRMKVRWRPAVGWRWVLVGLAVLGIFATRTDLSQDPLPPRQVLVVDRSDSVSGEAFETVRAQALAWQNAAENRFVIVFGRGVGIWSGEFDPQIVSGFSTESMDEALRLAGDLLGDAPGVILLASDGLPDSDYDLRQAVRDLAAAGHTLNVLSLDTQVTPNDLYIGDIQVPAGVWAGVPFGVTVPIGAPAAGTAFIELLIDGKVVEERSVQVIPGENRVSFSLQSGGGRILTIEVRGSWNGDSRLENNQSYAVVQVFASPKVLLVSDIGLSATRFSRALSGQGIAVDRISVRNLPSELGGFEGYQVVILHNIPSQDLSYEQVLALKVFTAKGGGLLVLGGKDAYTFGGYENTELAAMLPVEIETPGRGQRPAITFVMVLDRSASMSEGDGPFYPIDMAREAAIRTMENLRPEDHIGVLSFTYPGEDNFRWDVPLRLLGSGLELRTAQDAVSRLEAGGGTLMYQGLEEAVNTLARERPTEYMYILILTDGRSQDGSDIEFRFLAAYAKRQGITISTISLGTRTDPELLEVIADLGGGRFIEVPDPADLPQIMIAESEAVMAESAQPGETGVISGTPNHPVLSGFDPIEMPTLTGYHALVSKTEQGAEDILVSASFGDPILSAWQYGLGRVITWTGDLGQNWAAGWRDWDRQGEFWAQVMRYALPDADLGGGQVSLSVGIDEIVLDVYLQSQTGQPLDLATPTYRYADAGGTVTSFVIPQVGVGHYQLRFAAPPEGAYRGTVIYAVPGGQVETAAPFAVNYLDELRPGDAQAGRANLLRWAKMTGGGEVALAVEEVEQEEAGPETFGLIDTLLTALVILWLTEIIVRRQKMPWS